MNKYKKTALYMTLLTAILRCYTSRKQRKS